MTKSFLKKLSLVGLSAFLLNSQSFASKKINPTDTGQIVIINNFGMPQLNRQRTLRIYLPKNYTSSKLNYPVIYMQDGQNLFKGSAAIKSTWGIDSLLNTLPPGKQCIVVGIDHAGKDRITEYDPYDSTYGKGDGMAYARFIVETLKPYIDDHYRTKKDVAHTVIAGSSMGSLLAMYVACKYPGTFGTAGIFSPAFWIAPQIYKDAEKAGKKLKFYLTYGDKEGPLMAKPVTKMDSMLRAKKFSLNSVPAVKVNIGANHNEQQWRLAFPEFYNWLLRQF